MMSEYKYFHEEEKKKKPHVVGQPQPQPPNPYLDVMLPTGPIHSQQGPVHDD